MITLEKQCLRISPAFVAGWRTFLSVAQRLSLSAEVQTQVCSLQNTRAADQEHIHHLLKNGQVGFGLEAVPRSRPLAPSWRASLWVLQRDVSCSPGVCPLTYGIKLQRRRWLRKDQLRSITQVQGLLYKLNSFLCTTSTVWCTYQLLRCGCAKALWGEQWLPLPQWPPPPLYPGPAHRGHLLLHAGCSRWASTGAGCNQEKEHSNCDEHSVNIYTLKMKQRALLSLYLHKERNSVESSDNYSVVDISGQNVKCSCASLNNLLHTNSLLRGGGGEVH